MVVIGADSSDVIQPLIYTTDVEIIRALLPELQQLAPTAKLSVRKAFLGGSYLCSFYNTKVKDEGNQLRYWLIQKLCEHAESRLRPFVCMLARGWRRQTKPTKPISTSDLCADSLWNVQRKNESSCAIRA